MMFAKSEPFFLKTFTFSKEGGDAWMGSFSLLTVSLINSVFDFPIAGFCLSSSPFHWPKTLNEPSGLSSQAGFLLNYIFYLFTLQGLFDTC